MSSSSKVSDFEERGKTRGRESEPCRKDSLFDRFSACGGEDKIVSLAVRDGDGEGERELTYDYFAVALF